MLTIETDSPEATWQLGHLIGTLAQPGDVVCLEGELGAGKTTLVQGLAAGLGVSEPVTSPSFALIHHHHGRYHLRHIDLYRLSPDQVPELGLEELLEEAGVTAIEWPENLPRGMLPECLYLRLHTLRAEHRRALTLEARGPRAEARLDQVREHYRPGRVKTQ